jgi:hypothetical protein
MLAATIIVVLALLVAVSLGAFIEGRPSSVASREWPGD